VKIVLANSEFENQSIHLVKNEFTPLMPIVTFEDGKLTWSPIDGVSDYQVLKNGKSWEMTSATSVDISDVEEGEFQVVAIAKNGLSSFASEPVQIYPPADIQMMEIETVLSASSLPYRNFSGAGFVEISKSTNRVISFDIEVATDGLYAVDWRYANGNGPINTENKCAIRTLFVDNNRLGAQVFPHRGTNEWSIWGFSNAVQVRLKAGKHTLKLAFMPENENMNIEINQAMLDYVRLIKID
jgi:hypothetical protein